MKRVVLFVFALIAVLAMADAAWACRHCRVTYTLPCPAPCAEVVRDYVFPCCPKVLHAAPKRCCEPKPCCAPKTCCEKRDHCPKPCCTKPVCAPTKPCCEAGCGTVRCRCHVRRVRTACGCDACSETVVETKVVEPKASPSPSDAKPKAQTPTVAPPQNAAKPAAAPKPAAAAAPATPTAAAAPAAKPAEAPKAAAPAAPPKPAEKPAEAPKPAAKPVTPAPAPAKTTSTDRSMRLWTDSTGQHRVSARFVGLMDGGVVRLQKADGSYLRISIDRLSLADRTVVRTLASAVASR